MEQMLELEIYELAEKNGYGNQELKDIFLKVADEHERSGTPFDWDLFVGVTLEHDW